MKVVPKQPQLDKLSSKTQKESNSVLNVIRKAKINLLREKSSLVKKFLIQLIKLLKLINRLRNKVQKNRKKNKLINKRKFKEVNNLLSN